MTEEHTQAILMALRTRFGYEAVQVSQNPKQVRLLGRIPQQQTRNWQVGRHHIFLNERSHPWTVDISRQYFLRGEVEVFGWRLIFQGDNLAEHVKSITQTIMSAPRAKFELEEQALPGVSGPRRTMNDKGRGAGSAGAIPLILQGRR